VVFDTMPHVVERLVAEKAIGAASLKEFIQHLRAPRAIWLMVPAGAVDNMVEQMAPLLSARGAAEFQEKLLSAMRYESAVTSKSLRTSNKGLPDGCSF
jgi:NAD binding domain of 6-phosphogluconate dehydrogenase